MSRTVWFVLVLGLFAAISGGLAYFQFVKKPEIVQGFIKNAPQTVTTVAVVDAKAEQWVTHVSAVGTFRAAQGIDISPQVAGMIRAVDFISGQDVEKGALLVEIEDEVEQADLKNNLATLKNADAALNRQIQLIATGNTPRATLDAAQATRDSAAAAVEKSRALIGEKAIKAPFAGRVGLRKIDAGQYVSPGTSIGTLQQLDPIFVDFPVPEQNIGQLARNQAVDVRVDAWTNQVFRGKILTVDARVSPDTRTVIVRAEIENPDRKLLPGMFAKVDVIVGEPQSVVTLPRTSVVTSIYGDAVFVVKTVTAQTSPASTQTQKTFVERRDVTVGEERGDRVAIVSGVQAGETVVSEGQLKLAPNATVRVDNSLALPAPPNPRPKE
jgi:membrane fusion protein (multidrug efflux system)